ncbi:MAG TPA: HEAT repeat domain-containing protein [Planctomycetota bacterium]
MIDRLCKLLDDGDAELQIAVARVLRELKPKDAAVRKSLGGALKSQNEMVRLYALEALAAIDVQAALPILIPLLTASENVRTRATQIVIAAGAAAAGALTAACEAKDPQVRKAALDLLSKLPGVDISDTLFAALLDTDLQVIQKAAAAYRQKIGTMAAGEKAKALKKVLEFLASSKVQKAKTPLPSCLHLAGAFREASAAKDVVRYVDKKQPSEVRAAALVALGELPLEGKEARDVAAKLMPLLDEEDFHRIVKPALDVLWKIPPSPKDAPRLMKLQKTGGPAVRAFAVKALGSVGNVDAGEALLESLWSDDPRLSETASGAFRSNPDYVPLLAKALDKQEDMQKAFKVVHLLTQFKNVLDKGLVKKFLAKALSMLDRRESGFQAYFEVVRAAGPDLAKKEVLAKGRELLKKGKFEEAERALRLLQRDDLAAPESDLALAAAQLRQQRLDLAGSGRDQGHAIQLVQKLARKEGFPLLKQLEKEAAMFTPEGLLYVGFALVERQGDGRELGGDILKLVAKKFGGKEAGKVAKQKLKTQGVG